jgi:hypothetical protein
LKGTVLSTCHFFRRLRSGLGIGALILASTNLAHGAAGDRIERKFTVDEGDHFVMDVDRGSIQIKTAPGNTLQIEVIRKVYGFWQADNTLRDHHVEFTQDGGEVRVHARLDGGFQQKREAGLQVQYLVVAPRKLNVRLETRGGAITVSDLDGSVDVKTGGGSIRVHGVGGNVVAKTDGGSISVGEIQGGAVAHTSGGSIEIFDVAGKVDATTSGGSVRAGFSKSPGGDCSLVTSGGSIHVLLPENAAVDLKAGSGGGGVSTDFPVDAGSIRGKSLIEAKLNGGGPKFHAHTSGGRVFIGKRMNAK